MMLRAVLAVVKLLVWNHMPDRSKVTTQTKRDTLVLQVGVGREAVNLTPYLLRKVLKLETGRKQQRRQSMNKD
jgi:hypothetical protein